MDENASVTGLIIVALMWMLVPLMMASIEFTWFQGAVIKAVASTNLVFTVAMVSISVVGVDS